jgi:predicted peptidase
MKKPTKNPFNLLFAIVFLFIISCNEEELLIQDATLTNLPQDTGGVHLAKVIGTTSAEYGYYVYLPSGYEESKANYPLLLFLHGKGERGDGSNNPDMLAKVLRNGPPKMIERKQWNPTYPMIVISPQYHGNTGDLNNWGAGDPENLRKFIKYAIDNYNINTKRIYLTGLSHGGNGVYDYLTRQEDSTSYIAAAAPVAAYGKKSGMQKSRNTPIWVFVGDKDEVNMATSKEFVKRYNEQEPKPTHKAKISIYNGVGHNVWTRTYNGEGIGTTDPKFDPFDRSLYDWMFQFEREE